MVYFKKKDKQRTYLIMLMRAVSDCLYKSICCWYSFELHLQVDAIQMGTNNIYGFIKKWTKVGYTGCNLKTTELLDCAYRGMCGNKVKYGNLC